MGGVHGGDHDDRYSDALGQGASDAEARATALAELSDVLVPELRRVEEPWQQHDAIGNPQRSSWFEMLKQDVRYALRSLRLSPVFATTSLLTLGIGIGACTLILSVVNAVLLRPLPYHEPDRLAIFWGTAPERGLPEFKFPTGMAAVYRDRTRTLESFTAFGSAGFNLARDGEAERVEGATVSTDFFRVLGVTPLRGRVPLADEVVRNGPSRVVLLSHAVWMRLFGGDETLVGKTISLNGSPATVVGIMPPGFMFPDRTEAWTPLDLDGTNFNCWCYATMGRMRPGVKVSDVQREMAAITDNLAIERGTPNAKAGDAQIVAMSLIGKLVGGIERQLLILLAAVACVLLIACANIANLLLARTAARSRELAVRCCLGASPRRIAAQVMTESVILSLGGALLGAVVAAWATQLLRRLPTSQLPRIDEVRVDFAVLAATAGVALLAGILCGLFPAWRASRVELQDALKSGAKGSGTRSSRRVSDGFVVAQFALSLLLLVGAGLLLRSYFLLDNVDPGYRSDNVLVARLAPPSSRYGSDDVIRTFYARLLEQARALPGVRAVGTATRVPLAPGNSQDNVVAEGQEPKPGEATRVANVRTVTAEYFAAIGTPLLHGRLFDATDNERSTRVAVVDELFAKHFWPGVEPIGRRFRIGGNTSLVTVIGVVANVKHQSLDEAGDLQTYEPFSQNPTRSNYLVVRTDSERQGLTNELRGVLKSLDPAVPLFEVRTMREARASSLGTRRLTNVLLLGFSVTALLLAAIGIYGVMSLGVSGRVREFGIRLALGAKASDVRGLVLSRAMWLALIGVTLGLVGAAATTRYLRNLLFGVGPLDWVTFGGVALLLTVTALVASVIPAHRATRADPIRALRAE